jgi:hypothetical protein
MLLNFLQNIHLTAVAIFFLINYQDPLGPCNMWHYCHSQLRSFLPVMSVLLI